MYTLNLTSLEHFWNRPAAFGVQLTVTENDKKRCRSPKLKYLFVKTDSLFLDIPGEDLYHEAMRLANHTKTKSDQRYI